MLVQLAPLYGLMLGVNYWNSEMDDDYEDPRWHSIQIRLFIFAVVITWKTAGRGE